MVSCARQAVVRVDAIKVGIMVNSAALLRWTCRVASWKLMELLALLSRLCRSGRRLQDVRRFGRVDRLLLRFQSWTCASW